MPPKSTRPSAKASATNDEINDLFEGIGSDAPAATSSTTSKSASRTKGTTASASKTKTDRAGAGQDDILAELEDQLGESQQSYRPSTPAARENTAAAAAAGTETEPPKTSPASSTPPPAQDDSPGLTNKSVESSTTYHASPTPSASSAGSRAAEFSHSTKKTASHSATTPIASDSGSADASSSAGGWWGGIFTTATNAMKHAGAAVKEIQQNEEAKRWAGQVKNNVGALRGLGDELRHRALPAFTNILHTLAPPIAAHEKLHIHVTHHLVGYPLFDLLVHGVFARVMSQVEGGDLVVIQRPTQSTSIRPGDADTPGWRDGLWWRQVDNPRSLRPVDGLVQGTQLCRVSAETFAAEFFDDLGGIDVARQKAMEPSSESNPVRMSELFLAVQAITRSTDSSLFIPASSASGPDKAETKASAVVDQEDEVNNQEICFAVYVLDAIHEIRYATVSQAVPAKWVHWLEASNSPAADVAAGTTNDSRELQLTDLPAEIREIVESGGIDPREWVAEWIEEILSLAIGVVAQRYVARRMGVGEGALAKGKQPAEAILLDGAGEAGRASLI